MEHTVAEGNCEAGVRENDRFVTTVKSEVRDMQMYNRTGYGRTSAKRNKCSMDSHLNETGMSKRTVKR